MSVLDEDDLLGEEKLSSEIKNSLVISSKWAMFIAITNMVVTLTLVGLIAYMYSVMFSRNNYNVRFVSTVFVPQSILVVLLVIYCVIMIMFSTRFIKAVRENNQLTFESAVRLFKMWMILSACFLLMLLLLFLYTFRN